MIDERAEIEKFVESIQVTLPRFWQAATRGGLSVMAPIYDCLWRDGDRAVFSIQGVPPEMRHQGARAVLENIRADRRGALAVAMMMEAWNAEETEHSKLRPSQREDRRECLIAHVQLCDLPDRVFMWPLERDETGAWPGKVEPGSAVSNRMMPIRAVIS